MVLGGKLGRQSHILTKDHSLPSAAELAYFPQNGWIFPGTLRRNITLEDGAPAGEEDEARLVAALDAWCEDSAAANRTYRPMGGWDVRGVDDMSALFSKIRSSECGQYI